MSSNSRLQARISAIPALAAILAGAALPAQAADNFLEMFSQGKAGLDFRYRLETVDQDPFAKDARASTLRTRLNFRTADLNGFSLFGEYDYVLAAGLDDYNAGAGNTPDKGDYPVVADPEGWDLNQAYLQWQGSGGTLLRGGRERIIYDNARFVGNVGWRQNEQTYDGVYFQHKAGGFDWQAAWVSQVNRIFGRDVPDGRHQHDTWLLNGSKAWDGVGKVVGYYYDIHDEESAGFSTTTYGVRWTGEFKAGAAGLSYAAEYAHQSEAHNNPVDYSADYYRVDLAAAFRLATPYLGYESLGGDDTRAGAAFRTPLATLHAFNGWADKFLNTPNAGLQDFFVGVKGKLGTWAWDVLYHDFEAESGSDDYGSEWDASIGRAFLENYSVLFKAAWFDGNAGTPYEDTTKYWVQLTAAF